jgi:hypothetical protein
MKGKAVTSTCARRRRVLPSPLHRHRSPCSLARRDPSSAARDMVVQAIEMRSRQTHDAALWRGGRTGDIRSGHDFLDARPRCCAAPSPDPPIGRIWIVLASTYLEGVIEFGEHAARDCASTRPKCALVSAMLPGPPERCENAGNNGEHVGGLKTTENPPISASNCG